MSCLNLDVSERNSPTCFSYSMHYIRFRIQPISGFINDDASPFSSSHSRLSSSSLDSFRKVSMPIFVNLRKILCESSSGSRYHTSSRILTISSFFCYLHLYLLFWFLDRVSEGILVIFQTKICKFVENILKIIKLS